MKSYGSITIMRATNGFIVLYEEVEDEVGAHYVFEKFDDLVAWIKNNFDVDDTEVVQ